MKYDIIRNMLKESFWTKSEFNNFLMQYAAEEELDGIYFAVRKTYGEIERIYTYGHQLNGDPKFIKSEPVTEHLTIECSIWSPRGVSAQTSEEVLSLIKEHLGWQSFHRSAQLPTYEQSAVPQKCDATLHRLYSSQKAVAIFMIDLDHFKDVNDQNNHEVGSSVIFEFSNIILKCSEDNAIVVHRSGDEFFIIMPYTEPFEALTIAYNIRQMAKSHQYSRVTQRLDLTASQGICLLPTNTLSFAEAAKYAEDAYYPNAKNATKHRDSIRIVCPERSETPKMNQNLNLAYIQVRSGLDSESIFHNPYLDYVSHYVSHIVSMEQISDEINKLREWINPTEICGIQCPYSATAYDYECRYSFEGLAFSIFHGLCRNELCCNKEVSLEFNSAFSKDFLLRIDDTKVYSHGDAFDTNCAIRYAISLVSSSSVSDYESKTIVLLHIGHTPVIVPSNCFYRIIRVDTRPVTGGNLPDFWAAALSELFELLRNNPFISDIVVSGEQIYAKKLCDVLKSVVDWGKNKYTFSFLSKKTKHAIEDIEACKERLAHRIHFVDAGRDDKFIADLQSLYANSPLVYVSPKCETTYRSRRFLTRILPYDTFQLGQADGCKVETLDEAFPTVLEIIRSCRSNCLHENIRDQGGRELKELPNFKVIVSNPTSKDIPEYYCEEEAELEAYYESVFGRDDAFFQQHFKQSGQYDAVINHIAQLIDDSGLKYATRRAVLIIPHTVSEDDTNPLGLVSVYIAPRKTEKHIKFDFTFTWRTVEAVVGFPYSLYGSIKYSERIINDICNHVPRSQVSKLKIGSLSYFTYSMHMFLDNSYTEIVRGIINDATN